MFYFGSAGMTGVDSNAAEQQPLYWVAPMDANFRKDKPGKTPMGMDLIPFYGNQGVGSDSDPGTIMISPEVVNNLGVRTAKAMYAPLHSEISTVGYVKYDEDQLVHIHPRVQGWIEKLYIKSAGDPVTKGQALYEIYSPELVNAQEELLLAIDRKNKRLIRAAEDRLTALQLPNKAIINLRTAKKVKQTITFYAPQSGVIDNLNVREGFYVKPGTTLMSIGKLDQVWVEAEVFERQSSEVAIGIPVTMTLAYLPGKEWNGKVDYVYPTLDAKNRTVKVRLRFENRDKALKPNMFAQVVIHAESEQKVLLIPKEAVIRSGSTERVVLALGEGRFKSITVGIGRYGDEFAEVLAGLSEGDKVVSSAQFLLDSESSKSSDFKRMSYKVKADSISSGSVTVDGVINTVMIGHRMLNISRGPIKEWGRAAATLDFLVSKDIDMSSLSKGSRVKFTFHVAQGDFVITNIQSLTTDAMNMEK
jgi:Cu(I)/Ag(I) efflux system membrane fusion protein